MNTTTKSLNFHSRPYTVGVYIAVIVIFLFLLFHLLRIVIKKWRKFIATRSRINSPVRVETKRATGRRLTARSVRRLHNQLKKDTNVREINQVEFCNEKSKKFKKTVKIVDRGRQESEFFAGNSHLYINNE